MSQEFYILLAIMMLGQCFQLLLVVMVFVVLSSYLSYERRRLERFATTYNITEAATGWPVPPPNATAPPPSILKGKPKAN